MIETTTTNSVLTAADRAHFLEKGYLIVRDAIPAANLQEWQDLAWQRLGYDRRDPSTWAEPRVHLAPSRVVRVEDFAPRAFAALCEAVGGRDRVKEPFFWGDVFVCNFADSPAVLARHLAEHPEGMKANVANPLVAQCRQFEELTANAGDVIILHPFMLHAVSQNPLRLPRFISNPILQLKEPMRFNRADGRYSLVEQSILNALGVDSYDFQATAPRRVSEPAWLQEAAEGLEHQNEYRFPAVT